MVSRLEGAKLRTREGGKHSKHLAIYRGHQDVKISSKQQPRDRVKFHPVGINSRIGPSSSSVEVWLSRWSFGCPLCWSWPWWVLWRRGAAGVGDGSGEDRSWRNCRLVDKGEWNCKSCLHYDILILLWYILFSVEAFYLQICNLPKIICL